MRGILRRVAALLLLGLLASPLLCAEGIKLYLKNGTYQVVKSYEVQGDRVRYYSLERSDWEEIPTSLVDFAATKKAQAEEKAEQAKQLEQARRLEHERFQIPKNQGFEIKRGVRLPSAPGVYAYDGLRIIHLMQLPAHPVSDKKRAAVSLLMPAPLLKKQTLIILPGAKSAIRLFDPQPHFYVQDSDTWAAKAQLLPLKRRKDSRVVEKIRSGIGVGKSGEVREALPLERKRLAAGVYELTPAQPLAPGEYALAELLGDKLNVDVWDFGIDSTTPH